MRRIEKFRDGIRCQRCNIEIFSLRSGKKANKMCPDCQYEVRHEVVRLEKIFEKEQQWGY